jgi:hypothetical protein
MGNLITNFNNLQLWTNSKEKKKQVWLCGNLCKMVQWLYLKAKAVTLNNTLSFMGSSMAMFSIFNNR